MGRVDCDLGFLALVAHTSIFLSYSLLRFGSVWFGLQVGEKLDMACCSCKSSGQVIYEIHYCGLIFSRSKAARRYTSSRSFSSRLAAFDAGPSRGKCQFLFPSFSLRQVVRPTRALLHKPSLCRHRPFIAFILRSKDSERLRAARLSIEAHSTHRDCSFRGLALMSRSLLCRRS